MNPTKGNPTDAKKLFRSKGSCSHTTFHILNREFDNLHTDEEKAADPLAGGIFRQGYQCGMLWGTALSIGAESYKKCGNCGKANSLTIDATKNMIGEFVSIAKSPDCYDITSCDWENKLSIAKYMITGKFLSCFNLIEKWAPVSIRVVESETNKEFQHYDVTTQTCASELIKMMGGTEKEATTVSGFSGGLGLSGNACGALAAAVWKHSLNWSRENPGKQVYSNPKAKEIVEKFQKETGHEFLCSNLTGKIFKTIEEHSEFIKSGGCKKLLELLADN